MDSCGDMSYIQSKAVTKKSESQFHHPPGPQMHCCISSRFRGCASFRDLVFLQKSSLISHINGAGNKLEQLRGMAEFQHLDRSSSYGANLPAWVYATPDGASCLHVICVSASQLTLNIYRVFMHVP